MATILDLPKIIKNGKNQAKAFKLAWIAKFFSVEQPHRNENWKVIPECFFGKFGVSTSFCDAI